jgi:hypothetical protein
MATLEEYFKMDFNRIGCVQNEHRVTVSPAQVVSFPVRVHQDFEACAKFVSVYCPAGVYPLGLIQFYANDIGEALKIGASILIQSGRTGLEMETSSTDLQFTGRLFVYADCKVDPDELTRAKNFCRSRNIWLVVRDINYRDVRNRVHKPDAFICHDSRDKTNVAEPIALGLSKLLCHVWYDEYSMEVGDSLRECIERGIKESRTCIVVLSNDFFSNNGWTKAEFESIYIREILEGNNVMLPVWHGVTKEQVYEYSPRVASKLGVETDLGIEEVVRRLHRSIEKLH